MIINYVTINSIMWQLFQKAILMIFTATQNNHVYSVIMRPNVQESQIQKEQCIPLLCSQETWMDPRSLFQEQSFTRLSDSCCLHQSTFFPILYCAVLCILYCLLEALQPWTDCGRALRVRKMTRCQHCTSLANDLVRSNLEVNRRTFKAHDQY